MNIKEKIDRLEAKLEELEKRIAKLEDGWSNEDMFEVPERCE